MRISFLCGLAMLVGCNQTGVTTQQFQDLRDRVDTMEAENDALEAQAEALQAQLDAGVSSEDVAAIDTRLATLESDAIRLIAADTTLEVPGDHATLQDALVWLDSYRIAGDVWVTIDVAAGTYTFSEGILFQHPNGHRISIEGDLDDPASTVLHYTGDTGGPGFGRALRARSAVLGWLDGFTVRGDDEPGTVGIEASDGGTFWVGPNVIVEGFGRAGYRATRGGAVYAEGATATSNPGAGFLASNGGYVAAWAATSTGNGGSGFVARNGGVINADDSTSEGNGGAGFTASASSALTASSGVATDNGGVGFDAGSTSSIGLWNGATSTRNSDGYTAHGNGFLEGTGTTATDNDNFGYNVFWGGWMLATDTTSTGATYDYNIGPWSDGNPLPSQDGWGVIWQEDTE